MGFVGNLCNIEVIVFVQQCIDVTFIIFCGRMVGVKNRKDVEKEGKNERIKNI